jgi:hypothetical protein
VSTQQHRVSEGFVVPFTLPATVTAAVHHRCITATAFDSLPRNRGPTRTRIAEPNLATTRSMGRRIRLTGLLRETLETGIFL